MKKQNYLLHIFLFCLSVITTLLAGTELVTGKLWLLRSADPAHNLYFSDLASGVAYSASFLAFLTFHEFGHYLTAVYHRVRSSLPYYIPIFIPFVPVNIGSFGAVIRIREVPDSRKKFFDIGVAGPLAGFVVSLFLLIYGFSTLPDKEEYVYQIHPNYAEKGEIPTAQEIRESNEGAMVYEVGTNLLFEALKQTIPVDKKQVPPAHEMMHYPLLFVGFLTLFFTALNLLPIGQLDGGHVIYGLFGAKVHGVVSRATVILLIFIGGTGVVGLDPYDPEAFGPGMSMYWGWQIGSLVLYHLFLVFILRKVFSQYPILTIIFLATGIFLAQGLIKYFVPGLPSYGLWLLYAFMGVRFLGLDHPVTADERPLSSGRKVLAWLAIIIFLLCFTPFPLLVE